METILRITPRSNQLATDSQAPHTSRVLNSVCTHSKLTTRVKSLNVVWKRNSSRFVFWDLYRSTVPRLYSTLHTHPRFHRLWSVLPAHNFLSRPMGVSEGAIVQHPVYRHRRIYFPRTRVYKEKKDGRGPRRPQHLINIDPGAQRQGGTRCTPKALHILEVQATRQRSHTPEGGALAT